MILTPFRLLPARPLALLFAAILGVVPLSLPALAQISPFTQALAVAAGEDEVVSTFYRDRAYRPLWTGSADAGRRQAFLTTLQTAADHGLPVARYDANALIAAFRAARTEGDRGRIEVTMTRAFLDYARDIRTGVLVPSEADAGIIREVVLRDPRANLAGIEGADPVAFLNSLPPQSVDYARLMKGKLRLEDRIAQGGWGAPVAAGALAPGDSGDAVVSLRNRLMAMGYLGQTATQTYDTTIQAAVQAFQLSHGLVADGVAGSDTVDEINRSPEARLQSIVVSMERERWLNFDRGARHVWVNLTDFTAKIIDNDKVTFQTRSVVGKDVPDQRTPEFSDTMEFMVVNPSWNVPRSITTKEYLPLLQRNPNAVGHIQVIDSRGRVVPRGAVDFRQFTARNFPFAMRQAPSDGNALGLVKFMFPNSNNIYLHDTPQKSLFANEVRAYSHGCIRLNDPFDFAYALLARQSADPVGLFQATLATGAETVLTLDQPIPVHLVYFTAWSSARGEMNYRRDVYGRDQRIYEALEQAGVVLRPLQG